MVGENIMESRTASVAVRFRQRTLPVENFRSIGVLHRSLVSGGDVDALVRENAGLDRSDVDYGFVIEGSFLQPGGG